MAERMETPLPRIGRGCDWPCNYNGRIGPCGDLPVVDTVRAEGQPYGVCEHHLEFSRHGAVVDNDSKWTAVKEPHVHRCACGARWDEDANA